jgi:hypothetical protein
MALGQNQTCLKLFPVRMCKPHSFLCSSSQTAIWSPREGRDRPLNLAQGDWGGVVCNQEIATVVGSLSALQAGKAKEALRQPLSFSSCLKSLALEVAGKGNSDRKQ